MAENKDEKEIEEYWQITRYNKNGGSGSILKYTYETAFKEYCDTLKSISACTGDRLALYHVLKNGFVDLWFTTIIG